MPTARYANAKELRNPVSQELPGFFGGKDRSNAIGLFSIMRSAQTMYQDSDKL